MARFLIRLALFTAIQLVILAVVLNYGSPPTANHYLAAIHDKRALLATTEPPRLIFVGGSNVAFGINCETFQKHLRLHPINFGLHAGLGLDFPLRLVEEAVHKGDVVVVIPEYHLLTSEAYKKGHAETIAQLVEQWPDASKFFDSHQTTGIRQLLDHDGFWLTHLWVRRARHRLTRGWNSTTHTNTVYVRSNFNEYGDMVGHYGAESSPPRQKTETVLDSVAEPYVRRVVRRLNRFYTACSEKGVCVLFCYPPIPREVYEKSCGAIQQLDRQLSHSLQMPIIYAPYEVTYPREFFYDTMYHLNKEGAEQRSKTLLIGIRHHLLKLAHEPSAPKLRHPRHVQ